MKKILFLFILLFSVFISKSQKVYSVDYSHQADVKVFIVDYSHQADLLVYKVDYSHQAGKNNGKWYFVDLSLIHI